MADHKPSIVFVPGSFALPEFYDNITTAVAAKGYEIKAIRLPSVGAKSASSHTPDSEQDAQPHSQTTPTMFDDAAFITHEVTQLADQGKDVILIAHSYGGIPTSESIKGLAKAERTVGGVVRVAYITALVPKLGASAMDVLADVAPENRDELQIDVCLPCHCSY
jgi:pimeloyl-ACP methyl ester carboxylesterase